jgi:transposase
MNDPKACWAPRGVRPAVGAQLVREFMYVFGAISPADGCHDSLILPAANTQCMNRFLAELRSRHPTDYILVVLDGAGWHKSRELLLPESMELVPLPPYCPDLNPEEQVWDELREKAFGNRVFDSLDAVADAGADGLRKIESNPESLKRLAGRDWILEPY